MEALSKDNAYCFDSKRARPQRCVRTGCVAWEIIGSVRDIETIATGAGLKERPYPPYQFFSHLCPSSLETICADSAPLSATSNYWLHVPRRQPLPALTVR